MKKIEELGSKAVVGYVGVGREGRIGWELLAFV
jgi:hypothetical protein